MADSYQEIDALNQSLLKKILVSPAAFLAQQNRQGDSDEAHFVFGSLVDDMLLSDVKIKEKYYIMEASPLTDKLKNITQYIYDYSKNSDDVRPWSELEEIMLFACDEHSFQTKWKNETRVKHIKEKCGTYFQSLRHSEGKIIISDTDYDKAVNCVASLKADPYTKRFFSKEDHIEIWKHKVITFTYQGLDFKGELDQVVVDHKAKTIEPVDFKTTGKPIKGFSFDFWQYRYDFQSAVYLYGISKDPRVVELLKQGYTLIHFKYVVVETEMISSPMIFRVTNDVINMGWEGGTKRSGYPIEGFVQAVKRFKFHSSNDLWDYPMEYYEQKYLDIEV
jgi:hypothetical protein